MLSRLRKLLRSPTLSARDLQAAAGERPGGATRPLACGRLIRHLLLNFLLWAPAGHTVAREVISYVSVPFFHILIFIRISPKGPAFEGCVYQDAVHTCMAREEVDSGDEPHSLPLATPCHRRDNGGSEEGGDFSQGAGKSEVSCLLPVVQPLLPRIPEEQALGRCAVPGREAMANTQGRPHTPRGSRGWRVRSSPWRGFAQCFFRK